MKSSIIDYNNRISGSSGIRIFSNHVLNTSESVLPCTMAHQTIEPLTSAASTFSLPFAFQSWDPKHLLPISEYPWALDISDAKQLSSIAK